MEQPDFDQVVAEITQEEWEQNLEIGRFRKLQILKVMHRPFSVVGRCRVIGDKNESIVFIKKYRLQDGRTVQRHHEKIRQDMEAAHYWYTHFSDSHRFRVVRPVLDMPERSITVTEESTGENLFQILLQSAHLLAGTTKSQQLDKQVFMVGEWLNFKQQKMLIPNKNYNLNELVDYVNVRLEKLLEDPRRQFPAGLSPKVRNYFQEQISQVPENELLVTVNHSDFNPGNILIKNDIVTVLDFGRLVDGSYLLDVSKLYFQLELLTFKPQFSKSTIRRIQQMLLSGFGDANATEKMMFKLLLIRHILTHLANITRFWKFNLPERLYNTWVLRRELSILNRLIDS